MIDKSFIITASDKEIKALFRQLGHTCDLNMSGMRAHCVEHFDAGFVFTHPQGRETIRLSRLSRELGVDPNDVIQALQNATGEMLERKPNTKLSAEQAEAVRESISENSESGSVEGEISDDVQSAYDDAAQQQDAEKSKQLEMMQDWQKQVWSREDDEMSYEDMASFFEFAEKFGQSKESVEEPSGNDEAEDDPQKDKVEEGEEGCQEEEGLRFDLLEEHRTLDDADVAKWHADWKAQKALETRPDELPF